MQSHTLGNNDTIYIIVDGDKCKKSNHFVLPTQINFKLTDNQLLCLTGQYCFDCRQVQISRNLWAEHRSYHDKELAKPFLKGLEDLPDAQPEYGCPLDYPTPKRADESRLRKYGYTVSNNSKLTDTARRELLQHIIESKLESKAYIVSFLKHMIAINGKKESNFSALRKWERDLEFVLTL